MITTSVVDSDGAVMMSLKNIAMRNRSESCKYINVVSAVSGMYCDVALCSLRGNYFDLNNTFRQVTEFYTFRTGA